jgi:hypothetical protein
MTGSSGKAHFFCARICDKPVISFFERIFAKQQSNP